MSRADAADELHREAIKIADGHGSEWVRFTLNIERRKVD